MPLTPIERFMSKVDQTAGPDGCHPWTGNRFRNGYGRFWLASASHLAHRWILGEIIGRPLAWDETLREMACHRCDNPPCCNPKHLYVGHAKSNTADAIARERHATVREGAKQFCVRGHEFAPENIYWHANGSRQCRECRKVRQRKPGVVHQADRTHCPHGHRYDGSNTFVKNGSRNCRACHRDRERARRAAARTK